MTCHKNEGSRINDLRVVDTSIFPTIANGNLNASTIMVTARAADLILEIALLDRRHYNPKLNYHSTRKQSDEFKQRKYK